MNCGPPAAAGFPVGKKQRQGGKQKTETRIGRHFVVAGPFAAEQLVFKQNLIERNIERRHKTDEL